MTYNYEISQRDFIFMVMLLPLF